LFDVNPRNNYVNLLYTLNQYSSDLVTGIKKLTKELIMKFKINILILLLFNAAAVISAPLNFECDISPAPLKIDCPNDEFHSLGFYPPTDDPLYYLYSNTPEHYAIDYQWGSDYMSFAYGWYYTHGIAKVGVFDNPADVTTSDRNNSRLRIHSSGTFKRPFIFGTPTFNHNISESDTTRHGTLTLSLLQSDTNNTIGMSSMCRECTISHVAGFFSWIIVSDNSPSNPPPITTYTHEILDDGFDEMEQGFEYLMSNGNQVINVSLQFANKLSLITRPTVGGKWVTDILDNGEGQNPTSDGQLNTYASCELQQQVYGHKQEFCDILDIAYARDILVIASAGNNLKTTMAWPASDENVIGVAGIDPTGNLWERNTCFSTDNTGECGSNFDVINTTIAAPAMNMLVNHPGDYNLGALCYDNNFGTSTDGYQLCSGTSFSAPLITSIASMIRSLNPLTSNDDVKQILIDSKINNLPDQRYAVPRAGKSAIITLGKSNGAQVVNRLTPMFRMKTNPSGGWPGHISYLSTTAPQVAAVAKLGTYLVVPQADGNIHFSDRVTYKSDIYSPTTSGYPFIKGTSATARAPFYVFGGHRNPFNNDVADLLPLHHLVRPRFTGFNGVCSELADHAYSTNKSNSLLDDYVLCNQYAINYLYEGIDGYILPTCPNGVNCYENTGNANDAQCLKVRYSTQDNGFALMMASEVNKPMFASYGTNYKNGYGNMSPINTLSGMSNAECLGYVFPNVDSDSDGVIDGMELVLGTNPNIADTDGDGVTDGSEYPLAGIPQSDPTDPLDFIPNSPR